MNLPSPKMLPLLVDSGGVTFNSCLCDRATYIVLTVTKSHDTLYNKRRETKFQTTTAPKLNPQKSKSGQQGIKLFHSINTFVDSCRNLPFNTTLTGAAQC